MPSKTIFDHVQEWDAYFTRERVLKLIAKKTGYTVKRINAAYVRIAWDGYYGPISDSEWCRQDGRRIKMTDALKIMRKVLNTKLNLTATHPDVGYVCEGITNCNHLDHKEANEPGPLFHEEPFEIDDLEIMDALFPAIKQIYGTLRV